MKTRHEKKLLGKTELSNDTLMELNIGVHHHQEFILWLGH
jgi:hypothetical protein